MQDNKLRLDEISAVQKKVEALIHHWRRLTKEHKALMEQHEQLQRDYEKLQLDSANEIKTAALNWQEEKSLLVTN